MTTPPHGTDPSAHEHDGPSAPEVPCLSAPRPAAETSPIRVLVVDDHHIFAAGVAGEIRRADADIEVVGEAHDVTEAISMAREHVPDVVLLDVHLPGGEAVAARRSPPRSRGWAPPTARRCAAWPCRSPTPRRTCSP